MFRLSDPLWLLALLLIPFILWAHQKKKSGKIVFSSLPLSASRNGSNRGKIFFQIFPLWIKIAAFILMVIGLSRPQLVNRQTEVMSYGVDILLTLDTSGSMKALDFQLDGEEVDRLIAVKKVVSDFIQHRSSDRIGMVVFGESAYTQVPLTLDYHTLLYFLDQVQIGAVGDSTAIGDALVLSVKRLKDLASKSKVIILLTDGRNNAGRFNPEQAAEIAFRYGIKIYTIGIGTEGPVPFPEKTLFGTRRVLARLDIDNETLQKIADKTGGKFFHASDTEELQQIYSVIDSMEKSEAKLKQFETKKEIYPYFVFPALFLLFLEWLLSETIWRKFP